MTRRPADAAAAATALARLADAARRVEESADRIESAAARMVALERRLAAADPGREEHAARIETEALTPPKRGRRR